MKMSDKISDFSVGAAELFPQFALFASAAVSAAILYASMRNPAAIIWIYPAASCVILTSHVFSGPSVSLVFLAFFSLVSLVGVVAAAGPNKIVFGGAAVVSAAVFAVLLKYDEILSSRRAGYSHDKDELELELNETSDNLVRAKTMSSDLSARIENHSRLSGFLRSICKILDINELSAELKKSAPGCFGKGVSLVFLTEDAASEMFGRRLPDSKNDFAVSVDGRAAVARFLEEKDDLAWIAATSGSGKLTDDDIRFFSPAFDFARAAALNVILYEKTQRLSIRDSLTGLYLRSYFFERLAEEFEIARGHSEHLSVAMFDIDHFKKVNDTYGHAAGDEILKSVAQILGHRLRETDILSRYGGEEFVAAMPHTDIAEASRVISEIRKTVERQKFYARPAEGLRLGITLSAGIAASESGASSVEEIIKIADANLYIAKNSGRNKVVPELARNVDTKR